MLILFSFIPHSIPLWWFTCWPFRWCISIILISIHPHLMYLVVPWRVACGRRHFCHSLSPLLLRLQTHWRTFSFRWGLTTLCPLDFLFFKSIVLEATTPSSAKTLLNIIVVTSTCDQRSIKSVFQVTSTLLPPPPHPSPPHIQIYKVPQDAQATGHGVSNYLTVNTVNRIYEYVNHFDRIW